MADWHRHWHSGLWLFQLSAVSLQQMQKANIAKYFALIAHCSPSNAANSANAEHSNRLGCRFYCRTDNSARETCRRCQSMVNSLKTEGKRHQPSAKLAKASKSSNATAFLAWIAERFPSNGTIGSNCKTRFCANYAKNHQSQRYKKAVYGREPSFGKLRPAVVH